MDRVPCTPYSVFCATLHCTYLVANLWLFPAWRTVRSVQRTAYECRDEDMAAPGSRPGRPPSHAWSCSPGGDDGLHMIILDTKAGSSPREMQGNKGTRKGEGGLNDSTLGRAHWPSTLAHGSCMCRFTVACVAPCAVPRTQVPSQSGLVARYAYQKNAGQKIVQCTMYGRDARMPSVGRLIPVSGGFQNSAVRVSRAGPLLSCQPAPAPAPPSGPKTATLMRRETRFVDGDQSRSEQVAPLGCVMMALNPYGWKLDRSWSVSLPVVTTPHVLLAI